LSSFVEQHHAEVALCALVPIRPPASEPAPQLSCICCGSVSHLNPSHGPVLANGDEVER
jgi:hypothetical protein